MKVLTPIKAIRAKCLDCCCDNPYEVKMCTAEQCPLYVYRFGHNPKRQGIGMKGGNPNLRQASENENESDA